jgi:hypothetical protein
VRIHNGDDLLCNGYSIWMLVTGTQQGWKKLWLHCIHVLLSVALSKLFIFNRAEGDVYTDPTWFIVSPLERL